MAKRRPKRQDTVMVMFNSPSTVDDQFAASLVQNAVVERRLKAVTVGSGARINMVRNKLIQNFLDSPFTWLWMVDSDMVLPDNALSTLLDTAISKDRLVVGGLGYIYRPKEHPVLLQSIIHLLEDGSDTYAHNKPPTERFIECDATGFFCLLVHRKVLEDMQKHYGDQYNNVWVDELEHGAGNMRRGPDMEFFHRMKEATGVTPLIDTSVKTGHLKRVQFKHEDAVNEWNAWNPMEQI